MTSKVIKIVIEDREILIDKKDLKKLDVSIMRINKEGYVDYGKEKLHRVILEAPKGADVDHRNRNKLDNRRCNLRLCTPSENLMNRPKTRANTSGFKGVSFCKKSGKFKAEITAYKIRHSLGYFNTAEEASAAYKKAAKKYHGKFLYKEV